MAYVVGPKGQIVVAKEHRDQLGVGPGWIAIQRVLGDHLEVYFLPPSHRESLKASLAERLQAAFDRDRVTKEFTHGDQVPEKDKPDVDELAGDVEESQVELFDLVGESEPVVDSPEGSMTSPEETPVPQSPPSEVEVASAHRPKPPSVTTSKVKRGRGRFGWRR